MARKTEWYEEQAAKAAWRGTVDGRDAYVDRFKGQWEVCCRVTKGGKGVIMFTLTNKEAIRRLAEKVTPPFPDTVRKRLMKAAKRDVPVKVPGPSRAKVVAIVVLLLLAGAAAVAVVRHPTLAESLRGLWPW